MIVRRRMKNCWDRKKKRKVALYEKFEKEEGKEKEKQMVSGRLDAICIESGQVQHLSLLMGSGEAMVVMDFHSFNHSSSLNTRPVCETSYINTHLPTAYYRYDTWLG